MPVTDYWEHTHRIALLFFLGMFPGLTLHQGYQSQLSLAAPQQQVVGMTSCRSAEVALPPEFADSMAELEDLQSSKLLRDYRRYPTETIGSTQQQLQGRIKFCYSRISCSWKAVSGRPLEQTGCAQCSWRCLHCFWCYTGCRSL